MWQPLAETILGLTPAQVALVIAAIALIYAIARWRKNMIRKRSQTSRVESFAASAAPENPLNVGEIATELQALVAEIEETARRITAQLDNRCSRLELLLTEADEKIHRLEAAARPEDSPAASPDKPKSLSIAPPPPAPAPAASLTDAQKTLTKLRKERGAPPPALDPAYQPIYSLADRGKSIREIAQELDRQPGEIELILALRQHQHAS